jgi:1,4-alpha-glucan branching enzyme
MGLVKQYAKNKSICKVTFDLPAEGCPTAGQVYLVGDFNNWDINGAPMRKQKNGSWTITLQLEAGREYQFRYLVNGTAWENDWRADRYCSTHFGDAENSVVVT